MTGREEHWDVFVSYTKDDVDWARWIAWELEAGGLRVLIQDWDFVAGTNWVHMMQTGLAGSARMLAVLSTHYLKSAFGTAEWEAVWASDPLGQERKLLTVRVEHCRRPGLLNQIVGIDLFDVPQDDARQRLLAAVRSAISGSSRPSTAPPFPGQP